MDVGGSPLSPEVFPGLFSRWFRVEHRSMPLLGERRVSLYPLKDQFDKRFRPVRRTLGFSGGGGLPTSSPVFLVGRKLLLAMHCPTVGNQLHNQTLFNMMKLSMLLQEWSISYYVKDACVVSCARVVMFLAAVCIALCKKGDWLDTHGVTL